MNKIIRIVIAIFFIGFIIVFFLRYNDVELVKNDVELVKNGVLDYDKSITVGEAFNNWKVCKENIEWKAFQTENKRRIVQFSCDKKDNTGTRLIVFQFKINKDDTFDLSYIGEEYIDTDGIKTTANSSEPSRSSLKYVYDNSPWFIVN